MYTATAIKFYYFVVWRGRCDQGKVFSLKEVSPKRYHAANTSSNICVYEVCYVINLSE